MYARTCTYARGSIYISVYIFTCVQITAMYVYKYIDMRIYMSVYIFMDMFMYAPTYLHIYTKDTHSYAHRHTYI